jgi:ABC-type branched-subunit amino acid transport system ATPase component
LKQLEVKDLVVHYGKAEALKGISIGVDQGKIVTLIGANGAGKTTTLRSISGLKSPTSGEIWFEGEQIIGMPLHEIVRLGIAQVPEGRRVFATMTVLDNQRPGEHIRTLPRLKDKAGSAGWEFERWRATDVGHDSGPDDEPQVALDGRAKHGAIPHSGRGSGQNH